MCLRALTPAAALPGGRLNKDCCRRGSPRAIYRSRGFRNPSAAARKKHFKVFPKTTFVPTSPLISLSGPQNAVDGQLCVLGGAAYVSDLEHRPNNQQFSNFCCPGRGGGFRTASSVWDLSFDQAISRAMLVRGLALACGRS